MAGNAPFIILLSSEDETEVVEQANTMHDDRVRSEVEGGRLSADLFGFHIQIQAPAVHVIDSRAEANSFKAMETGKEPGVCSTTDIIGPSSLSTSDDELITNMTICEKYENAYNLGCCDRKEEDEDKEEDNVIFDTKAVDRSQFGEPLISLDSGNIDIEDNIVLRKLLGRPRYFDPPIEYYNCDEDENTAVSRATRKRRKPCLVCGSSKHNLRRCVQNKQCFVCSGRGHIAINCPDKQQENGLSCSICLRCKDPGHDMFSCTSDYSPDDLKEIQCYICKNFGHLCCIEFPDTGPIQVSCYNCGQSGHSGSLCPTTGSLRATGYRHGYGDHFGRRRTKYRKRVEALTDVQKLTDERKKPENDENHQAPGN